MGLITPAVPRDGVIFQNITCFFIIIKNRIHLAHEMQEFSTRLIYILIFTDGGWDGYNSVLPQLWLKNVVFPLISTILYQKKMMLIHLILPLCSMFELCLPMICYTSLSV